MTGHILPTGAGRAVMDDPHDPLHRAVSSQPDGRAFRVSAQAGAIVEDPIDVKVLT